MMWAAAVAYRWTGWLAVFVVWAAAVLGCLLLLEFYDRRAEMPLPVQEPAMPDNGYWQVWMFVHPHCPCSRASLRQLRTMLGRLQAGKSKPEVQATVWIVIPPEAAPGWEEGALLREVRCWQEAVIRLDVGAEQARRWGAVRSGHTVVTDPGGRVRFRGGVTAGRLREEQTAVVHRLTELILSNEGTAAFAQAQAQGSVPSAGEFQSTAPVYGCPLCSRE
jgi:hypothetical protein